ncbi:protein meiotic P26-like [Saccoglossus kowalevskii]|uniref:Tripartite motif-containing protein 2-like n=1 Tax=Saccoglossus kowalevskii TaxID=10224 RepID=A0ABM0LTX5_SACKO|nr:PREDICTED: tripartite motif-containing protein 2-like [Saccoglossus kowalevskii]
MSSKYVGFLLCSKCGYQFNKPKCLPCSHTFCEVCIPNDGGCTTCIICSRKHMITNGRVGDFPANILIMDLMDFYLNEPEFLCRSCTNDRSQLYCKSCFLLYCSSCADIHDKLPVTNRHTSISLHDFRQGEFLKTPFDRTMSCPNHFGNELELYCNVCDTPICKKCTESDHYGPSHTNEPINKFVTEKKAELGEAYTKGCALNLQLQSMKSIVDTEKKVNDNLSKTMNKTVGEHARVNVNRLECMIGDINKEKSLMLKRVDDTHAKKREEIDKQISRLKPEHGKIKKFKDAACLLQEIENDIGFLCLVNQEMFEANTILKNDLNHKKVGTMEFVENKERFRFSETLGFIAASEPISAQGNQNCFLVIQITIGW